MWNALVNSNQPTNRAVSCNLWLLLLFKLWFYGINKVVWLLIIIFSDLKPPCTVTYSALWTNLCLSVIVMVFLQVVTYLVTFTSWTLVTADDMAHSFSWIVKSLLNWHLVAAVATFTAAVFWVHIRLFMFIAGPVTRPTNLLVHLFRVVDCCLCLTFGQHGHACLIFM